MIYELLFLENPEDFSWPIFKDIALGRESEDFQKRLAQFDFKNMDNDMAMKLKNTKDQDYQTWQANDSLVDLLTWCDYIYDGYCMYALLVEKERELENAENKRDEKTVLLNASEKFIKMTTKSNSVLEGNLKQLESIRSKFINVLDECNNTQIDNDFQN